MIFSKRRVKLTADDSQYSIVLGLYLGYPECCARSFMEHHSALTYGHDTAFPLKGTGYVPCPVCASTYTDDELVEYIEANRFYPEQFPDHSGFDFSLDTNAHLREFVYQIITEGVEIGNRKAMQRVLFDIEVERFEQHAKWGEQNHPSFPAPDEHPSKEDAVADANEARQLCQDAFAEGKGTYSHIFAEELFEAFAEFDDPEKLRVELVQTAAVLVAWIEKLDREAAHGKVD